MNKKSIYIAGGIVLGVVILYMVRVNVTSAPVDSLTGKWIAKHPESVDPATANRKVPLLLRLINYNVVSTK